MRGTQFIAPALRLALRMSQTQRPPRYVALKIIAAILLGVAVIFAFVALYGYLRLHFSAVAINAFFAGGFAVIALLILAGIRIAQNRYHPPSLDEQLREEFQEGSAQFARLQRDLYRNIRRNEKSWLLAAAVLGIMMGAGARGKRQKPKSTP